MEQEIWKDIPGYDGNYKASSLGRVMACEKIVKGRWGNYVKKQKKIIKIVS